MKMCPFENICAGKYAFQEPLRFSFLFCIVPQVLTLAKLDTVDLESVFPVYEDVALL